MSSPIQHISDTALWVTTFRAWESERSDALFKDHLAKKLAGEKGEQIAKTMPDQKSTSWAISIRTRVIDDIVMKAVTEDGFDTVLNLACGLDTRPYRLQLPPSLNWTEVDLPDILSYKQEKLAGISPICKMETISMDLSNIARRRSLFERVNARSKKVLIITEGFLPYLNESDVASIAEDLAQYDKFSLWVMDFYSPLLLERLNKRMDKQLKESNSKWKFAPAEGSSFFARYGWKKREFYSTVKESRRLGRKSPMPWIFRMIIKFSSEEKKQMYRNMSGYLVLEKV